MNVRVAGRAAALMLALLMLTGCAGTRTVRDPDAPVPAPAPEVAAAAAADADDTSTRSALARERLDPWEPLNRRTYALNRGFDKLVFIPVARGYTRVVPPLLRRGVSNFFANMYQPVTALNYLLQGEGREAGSAIGRFLLNLTLGVGGVLDPASHAGMPHRSNDFGQTLAVWGWRESRYLVLPLFGPATLRDGIGKGVNSRTSPVRKVADEWGPGVSMLYGVDARAQSLPTEAFLAGAEDEYLMVRDAYLQRRRCQIEDCSEELPEYLLPDYEVELPDFEWRRR